MAEAKCFICRAGQGPETLPFGKVSEHLNDRSGFIWVDMVNPIQDQLDSLGEELGLHELAMEDALTTHQRPKLENYGDHLFISAKTAQLFEGHIFFGEVHFFAGPNFIATVRQGADLSFERVRDRLADTRSGLSPGSPYALYLFLDLIVDHYRPVLESLHDRFRGLENTLLSDALDRQDLERLYNVKRELSLLRDAAEPMHGIVQDLIRLHPEFVTRELKAYYRDVHDHALRVTAAIDTLRNNASDAMQFHLASLNIRQNESIQKLAGWGAILALPTVVFSLYGMNFSWMPELSQPWAYPVVLIATLAGSVWLYLRLKKRGWI